LTIKKIVVGEEFVYLSKVSLGKNLSKPPADQGLLSSDTELYPSPDSSSGLNYLTYTPNTGIPEEEELTSEKLVASINKPLYPGLGISSLEELLVHPDVSGVAHA
jgi:hypothetical protein